MQTTKFENKVISIDEAVERINELYENEFDIEARTFAKAFKIALSNHLHCSFAKAQQLYEIWSHTYNITLMNYFRNCNKRSEEAKANIANGHKKMLANMTDDEIKEKYGSKNRGRTLSDEHKKKIAQAMRSTYSRKSNLSCDLP